MSLRAPDFWHRPPGMLATLLSPLAAIWRWQTARRVGRAGALVDVPVICVGNLTAGGTGKTPVVMHLAQVLTAAGHRPHILSRGYGGADTGMRQVQADRDRADDVGDEPLLLAAFAPVWIGADRAASARAAIEAGADVLLMDDGFQNPGLVKDLSIVVVDAASGFGNGRVMPAGPLREPVAAGLARASVVILLGSAADRARFDRAALGDISIVEGEIAPLETGMDWQGLRALAFAGIGRPAKFFDTLEALGAEVITRREFPDHAPYSAAILERLARDADSQRAQLVTTEKDAVRLPPAFRSRVLVLPVRLKLTSPAALEAALDQLSLPSRSSANSS